VNGAIEATAVELEQVSDRTLVGIRDPLEALAEYTRVANGFNAALKDGDMITKIGGREFVQNSGWVTLGSIFGITPVVTWTKPLENGWEARAEARTLDGRVIGAGEAMCTRAERNWARRDDYAIRSMAQTRAQSKALRGPLGFVMTLAGHEATPADEVESTPAESTAAELELPGWARAASPGATAKALTTILEKIGVKEPAVDARKLGQSIFERCENTVPACVLFVLKELAVWIEAEEALGSEPESS
jgi:hypothetical protein